MDKGNVHVAVCVLHMLRLEAGSSALEPADLTGLYPVVAREVALIGAVGVGIQEVDGEGGVVRCASGQNFHIVIPYAINVVGASHRERVGKSLHESHLSLAGHGFFIVMVAKDGSIGNLALDEERDNFENGLGVSDETRTSN